MRIHCSRASRSGTGVTERAIAITEPDPANGLDDADQSSADSAAEADVDGAAASSLHREDDGAAPAGPRLWVRSVLSHDASDADPSRTGRDAEALDLRRAEGREAVQQAMRSLPERDREVLRRYFVDAATQREIAAEAGVSPTQVSRWIVSAVDRLRAQLLGE